MQMTSRSRSAWVLSLLVLAVLLAAPAVSAERYTLTILGIGGWTPSELAVTMGPLFEEYARKNLGYEVKVQADFAPFTALYEKAASAFAAHSDAYDIVISDSQWLGAFSEGGHIVQLNNLINSDPRLREVVRDIYPEHRASYMTYPDGSTTYWGLPQEGDDLVLYVRKDLLNDPKERRNFKAKYGWDMPSKYEDFLDLTWDKFEQMLEFFTRPSQGLYGFAGEYAKEYDFISDHVMSMIWTWGGDIMDWKTFRVNGVMNSPASVEALEYYVKLLKYQPPGAVNYGIDQVINVFAQGQVFSALTWAAVGRPIFDPKLSKVHDKTLVVVPPGKIVNGQFRRVYCLGGQPWVISKYSKNQKIAVDFLKWWYLPETQWEFARRGGNPVVRSVIDTEEFKNLNPWNRAYVDMIPGGRDFWHLPEYAELLLIQQEEWTAYASGAVKSAKQAMDNIARRQEEVLMMAGRL